jgi:hypothetical protein
MCWWRILIPSCYGIGDVEYIVGRRGWCEDQNAEGSEVDLVEVIPVVRQGRIPHRDRRATSTI